MPLCTWVHFRQPAYVCRCECACVFVYDDMYIHIYDVAHLPICQCVCKCLSIWVCFCILQVDIDVCMYANMWGYICVPICVHVCICDRRETMGIFHMYRGIYIGISVPSPLYAYVCTHVRSCPNIVLQSPVLLPCFRPTVVTVGAHQTDCLHCQKAVAWEGSLCFPYTHNICLWMWLNIKNLWHVEAALYWWVLEGDVYGDNSHLPPSLGVLHCVSWIQDSEFCHSFLCMFVFKAGVHFLI